MWGQLTPKSGKKSYRDNELQSDEFRIFTLYQLIFKRAYRRQFYRYPYETFSVHAQEYEERKLTVQ